MIDINRKTAYEILYEIERDGAYGSSEILARENNPDVDGDFVRRLVYGVMERKLYLDYILDKFVNRGVSKVDKKVLPILRMGLYQIMFMDSVPEYAAIDSSVELAKEFAEGRDGFVNAVLRSYLREPEVELPKEKKSPAKYLSVKYSVDESIIKNWIDEYGEEATEKMLASILDDGSMAIRVNTIKTRRDRMLSELKGLGIDAQPSELSARSIIIRNAGDNRITDLEAYKDGRISIQSQESTWIADLVDAKPEENILDVCAAPGGKTMAMAESMNNKGSILAWDIYEHRLASIGEQKRRLGIAIVKSEMQDGGEYREELYEVFDGVLVDAPCSGFGVMGRKPEIRYRSMKDIKELPGAQLRILETACNYVKLNGRLVYSTCTINRDENQKVIEKFLKRHKNFSIDTEKQLTPIDGYNGFYAAVLVKTR